MSYENYETWREVLEGQKKSKLQDENERKSPGESPSGRGWLERTDLIGKLSREKIMEQKVVTEVAGRKKINK